MADIKTLDEAKKSELANWTQAYAKDVPVLLEARAATADPKAVVDPATELYEALKQHRINHLSALLVQLKEQETAIRAELATLTPKE